MQRQKFLQCGTLFHLLKDSGFFQATAEDIIISWSTETALKSVFFTETFLFQMQLPFEAIPSIVLISAPSHCTTGSARFTLTINMIIACTTVASTTTYMSTGKSKVLTNNAPKAYVAPHCETGTINCHRNYRRVFSLQMNDFSWTSFSSPTHSFRYPKKRTLTPGKPRCQLFSYSLTTSRKINVSFTCVKGCICRNIIRLHRALPKFMLLYFTCSSLWQRPENDLFVPFKTCNVLCMQNSIISSASTDSPWFPIQ